MKGFGICVAIISIAFVLGQRPVMLSATNESSDEFDGIVNPTTGEFICGPIFSDHATLYLEHQAVRGADYAVVGAAMKLQVNIR